MGIILGKISIKINKELFRPKVEKQRQVAKLMLPGKIMKRDQRVKVTSKYIGLTLRDLAQQKKGGPYLLRIKYILLYNFYHAYVTHFFPIFNI